jgi:hypothetical protein
MLLAWAFSDILVAVAAHSSMCTPAAKCGKAVRRTAHRTGARTALLLSVAFKRTEHAALTSILCTRRASGHELAAARFIYIKGLGVAGRKTLTLLQSWRSAAVANMSNVLRLRNTRRVLAGSKAAVEKERPPQQAADAGAAADIMRPLGRARSRQRETAQCGIVSHAAGATLVAAVC